MPDTRPVVNSESYPCRTEKVFALKYLKVVRRHRVAETFGAQALCLLTVIALTEDDTGYRKPVRFAIDDLAKQSGIGNRRTFIKIRNALVDAGWLHCHHPNGAMAEYWVRLPDGVSLGTPSSGSSATTLPCPSGIKSDTSFTPTCGTSATSSLPTTCGKSATGVTLTCGKSATGFTPTCGTSATVSSLLIPSNTLSPEKERAREEKPTEQKTPATDARFLAVRSVYPEHRRGDLAEELAVWQSLAPDDAAAASILDHIKARTKSQEWTRESRRWVPRLAKYLRSRQWEGAGTAPVDPEEQRRLAAKQEQQEYREDLRRRKEDKQRRLEALMGASQPNERKPSP